jgi:hypothetical protein
MKGFPMNEFALLVAVAVLVASLVLSEIVAAVLPIIIVVVLIPPQERDDLARLLAACDSSRRLRLWSALRTAVEARRRARRRAHRRDPLRNAAGDREGPFSGARGGEMEINLPWRDAAYSDRPLRHSNGPSDDR